MGLFDFLNRSPDMYGQLLGGQRPQVDTSLPIEQMRFGIDSAMATPEPPGTLLGSLKGVFGGGGQQQKGKIQDLAEEMGLPKPQEQWKTLLPVLLTQVGAALMQPPGPQRAAVFAQLPATMLAAQKMNREDAQNRALMGIEKKKMDIEARKNMQKMTEIELFQTDPEAYARMQELKKPQQERNQSIDQAIAKAIKDGNKPLAEQLVAYKQKMQKAPLPVQFVNPQPGAVYPPGTRAMPQQPPGVTFVENPVPGKNYPRGTRTIPKESAGVTYVNPEPGVKYGPGTRAMPKAAKTSEMDKAIADAIRAANGLAPEAATPTAGGLQSMSTEELIRLRDAKRKGQ